ncbi:glycosyltransferase family 4 protein [Chthonomonas calidirosea]|uniref:glycosyltransferase family 4 protein n=1 Tax=Chthonomonas calidirosea TaxID=454171 RepID=UPI0006EC9712|nr:glycosyltransferase [Chthonomonas calidirosea]CEK15915.1 glycosyltransferase [Chthonomonas calidirosea]
MRLGIIAPALPPQRDGIGDYTANLVQELAKQHHVVVFIPQEYAHHPIPQVEVAKPFSYSQPKSVSNLPKIVADYKLDWLLLQYNPFSYGRWGFNPWLPFAMRAVKRRGVHFAVMFHETFVPVLNWKFAVMTTWQRFQARELWRASERCFISTEAWWHQQLAPWSGGPRPIHLPVGSNIPYLGIPPDEARSRLAIAPETLVLGYFGTVHGALRLSWFRQALQQLQSRSLPVLFLYIGPNQKEMCALFENLPIRADGLCPPAEVSLRLSAVDIYLAPFVDGVSTRRSSYITALAHRLPSVGTLGEHTDSLWMSTNGTAYLLTPAEDQKAFLDAVALLALNPDRRMAMGREARAFYESNFTWERIGGELIYHFTSGVSR